MADRTSTGRSANAAGKRLVLIAVGIAILLVAIMAVVVLILSGGEETGDGTGRSELTTPASSDVVTGTGTDR